MFAFIAAILATGFQAYSQYQAGKAAEAEGKLAQQLADRNAKIKEREGEAEVQRGREEALQRKKIGDQLEATQRVGFAKGGVLGVTPEIVVEKTGEDTLTDRMTILRNAFLNQSFRESEAANIRFGGAVAKFKGQSAARAGKFKAIGTLLTGALSLGGGAKTPTKGGGLSKTSPLRTQSGRRTIGSGSRNFPQKSFGTVTTGGANRPTVTRRI